jgi:myosin heavy chain 1/2/3/4/8/13/7B/15
MIYLTFSLNLKERTFQMEKLKKSYEQQVRDLVSRLDEQESNVLKGGKRILHSLEKRIADLESELDAEQRAHQETVKELRKNERRIKELSLQADEDRRQQARLQEMVDKIQSKNRLLKKQAEDAEEIAANNLAKFRKAQHDLEDAEASQVTSRYRNTVSVEREPVVTISTQQYITRASSVVPQRATSVRRN